MKKLLVLCRLQTILTLIILSNAGLTARAQDNALFRHLPPDAEKVYHVNLQTLLSKLDLNALAPFAQMAKGDIASLLKDPALTGVDLQKGIFITQRGSSLDKGLTYITILVQLTDSGKFISLVMSDDKKFHRVHIGKEAAATSGNSGYAWNDQLAVITIIKSSRDTTSRIQSVPIAHGTLAVQKSLASLKGYDNSVYATNAFFKTGFSDDADFHFWAPQGTFFELLSALAKNKMPVGNSMAIKEAMSKIHGNTLMSMKFDQGKIIFTSKTPLSPDTAALYASMHGKHYNPDLLTRIPGGSLLGIVDINIDFSATEAFFKMSKITEKMDSLLAKAGIKFSDITRSFKGDFLIAAVAPEETGSAQTIPNIYFVTTIGDRATFDKFTGQIHLLDTTSGASLLDKIKASYTLRDNTLVIGRSKTLTDAYFTAASRRNTDLVTTEMQKYPYSIAIDLKAVAAWIRSMNAGDSPKMQQALHFLDAVDKFTMSLGAIENNTLTTEVELKMADQSTNSLRALLNLTH